ncbi:type IV pilus biogenesis/stability protein PilW [Comamonas composti]|uniref:type IV pilus biogenesis/stability protein PilW n=1 Tax=Comamonas composti TaxID=408558 RepID=UPI001FE075AF|nr:type IV pilus biogenesis/stability protein PilW [Comamonas composti]
MRWGLPVLFVLLSGCATQQTSVTANAQAANAPAGPEADLQQRARIRLELAASYFQADRMDVAAEEVGQVLAMTPNNADAHSLQGLIYMRNQDWLRADASLQKAISLRPQDGDLQHNYGWLQCQRKLFADAQQWFDKAMTQPGYRGAPKTLLAKGLCYHQDGRLDLAQKSLFEAYEMDAANPVVAYHLSNVMVLRGETKRAQFYIRRLNNSAQANAESLWLGIKVERAMQDQVAMRQLAEQLQKRFPDSRQWMAYERGAFNE